MLRVALTGGIAAGKSTVSARLRQLGVPVGDADRFARDVLAPGSAALAAVLSEFGPGVAALDGSLDRAALGGIVFGDPVARRRLEEIVHPLVRRASAAFMERQRAAGAPVAVLDIPLLVETGQAGDFDLVVTVSAPTRLRLERAAARGLSLGQARARLAAQATDAQREAAAHVVLDGSGSPALLRRQVDEVLLPAIGLAGRGAPDGAGPVNS
ncbi:MAG: dephospho-CoA kinase [Bifidobacteriaceae bacterium]|jgi:dephospho-CoA kinase|nr:dephospho-CoA kinase [Bifidobacteriaceae bacterium]